MKKAIILAELLFAILIGTVVSGDVSIDPAHFPDAAFRSAVAASFDKNHDDVLSTSEANGDLWMTLRCDGKGISSLEGVEYLTGLENLYCYNNNLTSLDVSKNTSLVQLFCEKNQLASINVTECRKLQQLRCYSNRLSSIDVRNCPALNYLNCAMNQISAIDTTQNPSLKNFQIFENNLSLLDVSSNTRLEELWCSSNKISSLVLGSNDRLKYLSCYDNPFTRLDISNNRELRNIAALEFRHEEANDYVYYMRGDDVLRFAKTVELVLGDRVIPATIAPTSPSDTNSGSNSGTNPTNGSNGGSGNSSANNSGGGSGNSSANNSGGGSGNNSGQKYSQPMKVKGKTPSVKASKLKKKKQTISKSKAFAVSGAQGAVSFKKKSGSKKISISRAGTITVKKGTKKGTYKIKVAVTAAGNGEYKAGTKVVTIKVKVN